VSFLHNSRQSIFHAIILSVEVCRKAGYGGSAATLHRFILGMADEGGNI
jgi:hypothetical protein